MNWEWELKKKKGIFAINKVVTFSQYVCVEIFQIAPSMWVGIWNLV